MACVYDKIYSLGCRDGLGGLNKVYLRNWSASTVYTYDSLGQITGGTNVGSTNPWYTIDQVSETGEWNPGKGTHTLENGTNMYEQTLSLVFHKYKYDLRTLVYVLAQQRIEGVVLNNNGDYFVFGEEFGANVTDSDAKGGKNLTDLNGTTVTLTAKGKSTARQMTSTFFSTFTLV